MTPFCSQGRNFYQNNKRCKLCVLPFFWAWSSSTSGVKNQRGLWFVPGYRASRRPFPLRAQWYSKCLPHFHSFASCALLLKFFSFHMNSCFLGIVSTFLYGCTSSLSKTEDVYHRLWFRSPAELLGREDPLEETGWERGKTIH